MTDIRLEESWRQALAEEFSAPYMAELKSFLNAQRAKGLSIFPKGAHWFRALDLTPLDQVRVVILGQDPYHGEGQAHGLCFSVQPDTRVPPSLLNIYKELQSDLGIVPSAHGFLESWAAQGVLLLNSVLTVEMGRAASHQGKGWETLTDRIIALVDQSPRPIVFMLWGAYAQRKAGFVNSARHLVLKAAHPSPLSAHNGFLGCRHFSKANQFLEQTGQQPINWRLPSN